MDSGGNAQLTHQARIEMLQAQVAPVLPEDTLTEAARKALLHDFIRMLQNEDGSRLGIDPEYVHDMRVAIRRMRSIFRELGSEFKSKRVDQAQRELPRLARTLGGVRDLDVIIDNLERFKETLAEDDQAALQPALTLLNERRVSARKQLMRSLDRDRYRRFIESFGKFVTVPGEAASLDAPVPEEARHLLPIAVYQRLAAVRAYDHLIDKGDPETLHMLRIEFKRLRYLISVFEDLLGKQGKEFVAELKTIQDHLGKLNDAAVAQARLRPLLSELNGNEAAVLEMYIGTLANEETHLRDSFPDVWRRFNTRTVQRQLANAIAGL